MNGHCGGCRARAYGMTDDVMAEIPSAPTRRASSPGLPCSPSAAQVVNRRGTRSDRNPLRVRIHDDHLLG